MNPMSYTSDVAEQVVQITLDGAKTALRVAGNAAVSITELLTAVLQNQQQTPGQTQFVQALKDGPDMRVFAIRDADLVSFVQEAKAYGIPYYTLRSERSADSEVIYLLTPEADSARVDRILERSCPDPAMPESPGPSTEPEQSAPEPRRDVFEEILRSGAENPTAARNGSGAPSAPSSRSGNASRSETDRPSVREALARIREEQRLLRKQQEQQRRARSRARREQEAER